MIFFWLRFEVQPPADVSMLDVPNEADDLGGNGAGQNNGNVPDREPKRSKSNSVSENKEESTNGTSSPNIGNVLASSHVPSSLLENVENKRDNQSVNSVKHKELVGDIVMYSSSTYALSSISPKILEPLFKLVASPMSSVMHGEAYTPIQKTPLNLNSSVIGEGDGRRSLQGAQQPRHAAWPTSISHAAVDAQAGQTAQLLEKASAVAFAPSAKSVGPLGKKGPFGPACNSPLRTKTQPNMHGRGGSRGTSIS
jgi:hypothetical protein